MSEVIAIAPFTIQDAPDGPGELTQADKGLIFAWDGERMIVIPPQTIAQQAQPVLLRAGGGAWNIQNAVDGPGTLGSSDNGKVVKWDNSSGHFVMGSADNGDANTLDGLDSTAFLLAAGTRTGATSQAQIFTTGVGIGSGITSPATLFQVVDTSTSSPRGIMSSQYSTTTDGARFHMRKGRGTLATPTTVASGDTLGRLVASGYDGSAYQEMASIAFVSSGTVASTRVPTEIQFFTATDAVPSVMTQRMVIDNAGNVGIANATPSQALDVTGSVKYSGSLIGPAWKPASNSTTALQIQNAAGTAIVTLDTTNSRVGIGTTPSYVFHTQLLETPATSIGAQIANNGGTELITNTTDRDFSGAGNWTGTNWAVSGGALLHTAGSTANATLTNANLTASSIINGRYYMLTYTIAGMTTGTLTPKLGAVSLTAQTANGTYTDYVVAGADNVDLIFTPTSAFDGSIDNISLQRVAGQLTMLNTGKVGIGTNNPSTMLEVIDPTNTPFNLVRRSTATATSNGGFNAVHETTQTAADGFGVHQSFRIRDASAVTTTIGQFGAVRDGALNSGAMVVRCTSAGTVTERARWSNLGVYTQSAGGSETNTVVNIALLKKTSSGTPAAGFGAGIDFQLKSSTTVDQDAAVIEALWQTATHASRASDMVFSAYNVTTKREFLRGRGGSSNAQIGFLGATPVSRTSAYTPTNVTTDRAYDANATTVDELADVLGTLIADLQAFGLLG